MLEEDAERRNTDACRSRGGADVGEKAGMFRPVRPRGMPAGLMTRVACLLLVTIPP